MPNIPRTKKADLRAERLAAASERYWACRPDVRELVIRAFEAHLVGLALKYGASTINDLWNRARPLIAIYDSALRHKPIEMQDAIEAYWVAHIYPGGVLAYAIFGLGILNVSAVEWMVRATDSELLAILPRPWLDGPILIDLCAENTWLEATPRQQKDALNGLIRLATLGQPRRIQ